MSAGKIAVFLVLAAVLFVGSMILVDEYRMYRAEQKLEQLGTVDGLTPRQQAEIAAASGNDRYYPDAEVEAYIAREEKRLGIASTDPRSTDRTH